MPKKIKIGVEQRGNDRRGGRDKEHVRAEAERIGKEGFSSAREQYIFTRQPNLPSYILAAIWGVTQRAIEMKKTRASKNGDDWQSAREIHLKRVASGITEATRESAKEETQDLTSNLLSINGAFLLKVSSALHGADKPTDIAALTRAFKTVVDLFDKLSGRQAQEAVFDARRSENDYLVAMVEHYVDDPELARRFAQGMSQRRAMIGFDAKMSYKSQIDGVYRVAPIVEDAEKAVDEVREGRANLRRKFVD